jgi:hypothetical protein
MALDMRDSIKILKEIKSVLKKKSASDKVIDIEQKCLVSIEISKDEMLGDQLLGHPLMKELQESVKLSACNLSEE